MRPGARRVVDRNIALHGHHTYVVAPKAYPRFAYTIGLLPVLGAELVMAGALYYVAKDVDDILRDPLGYFLLQT
jgi:hypothetical protein